MTRIPTKIVRIKDVGLTLKYLNLPQDERDLQSERTVTGALEQMKMLGTVDGKLDIMKSLLERSIKQLEIEEEFEEAQILLDIVKAIPRVFSHITQT